MSGFQESPSRLRYYREHPIVDMKNFAQLPFASKPDAPARESGDDLWVTDCVFPCSRCGLGWSTSNILGKSGRGRISPRVILGKADSIRARPHFPVRNTLRAHCRPVASTSSPRRGKAGSARRRCLPAPEPSSLTKTSRRSTKSFVERPVHRPRYFTSSIGNSFFPATTSHFSGVLARSRYRRGIGDSAGFASAGMPFGGGGGRTATT